MIKYGSPANDQPNLDNCKSFLNNLVKPPTIESLKEMVEFLEVNAIQNDILTGPMLEECNRYFKLGREVLMNDCEIAMDVFDVLSNSKLIEQNYFGISGASSCISILAIVISSMVLKVRFLNLTLPH